MLALADLDRDELLALAERYCPTGGADLARARYEAALAREKVLKLEWERASRLAVADARAARLHSENHGFDERFRALFATSKHSTAVSAERWKALEKLMRRREQLARELKKVAA